MKQPFSKPLSIVLRIFWTAAFAGLLFILPGSARTQTLPAHQVFVALTPGLRAEDLTSPLLPALRLLRSEGAAGWMVCRAARATDRRQLAPDGRDTPASLALTLGSGVRAIATTGEVRLAIPDAVNSSSPVNSFLDALREVNRSVDHAVSIGALGDLVHRQGGRTALIGSAQTDSAFTDDTLNAGWLLAMDGTGRIDSVPSSSDKLNKSITDPSAPYGRRDDVPALLKKASGLDSRFALVVIAFGDLERADRYGPLCLPAPSALHRANALRALDALVSGLRRQLATKRANIGGTMPPPRLYLLAPAPALSTPAVDRVAPVCVWGAGVSPGTLTSPSTRTSGIVVNTDFLPSIAADLGMPLPSGAIGRPFAVQATPIQNTVDDWKTRHDRLLQSERLKDAYGGLPTVQALLVLAALWAFRKQKRRPAGALAIVIVSLPLGMLLLPSLPFVPRSPLGAGLTLAAFAGLFALSAWFAYPHPPRLRSLLLALCAVLPIVILLDLLTGSHLLREAWMSYSVMETARFYGIGNEYMGVVIGASCVLMGRQKTEDGRQKQIRSLSQGEQKTKAAVSLKLPSSVFRLLSAAFSLFLVVILGYNRFGAKVGAVPSAGCALGVELLALWRGRVRARDVGILVIGAGLLLGVLVLLDMRHAAGEQSHLARAFLGGGGNVVAIAQRKLSLEGYLLLHSPWSLALLCATGAFWNVGRERQGDKETRRQGEDDQSGGPSSFILHPSFFGLVTGAIASLLCNDSGVTAAAMIMLFGCVRALIDA